MLFSGALFALIFIQQTYAAIFSFSQTSWVGGSTVTTATHASDRTGWTEYASQSGLVAGADVRILPTSYTFTDDGTTSVAPSGGPTTSGGDFDSGTNSSTAVLGSGTGASVGLLGTTIAVNAWDTALKAVPGAIGVGSQMIRNGVDDDIYVTQGNGTAVFYRYSISGNSWTTLTSVPGAIGAGSQMIRNGADNDIYVIQGNGGTGLYKYSISGNSWTILTSVPGAVNADSSMTRNGADNDIYVSQGGATGFYRYSISGNSWTILTSFSCYTWGSSGRMIRNGSDNDAYFQSGGGLCKYSISGNSWVVLASPPNAIGQQGSTMIRNAADDDIYIVQGGTSTGFLKYSISSNSWTTLSYAPGQIRLGSNMIRNGADNDIYVTQGDGLTGFFKYSISGNSWTILTAVPGSVRLGSSMLRNSSSNEIYFLRGNNTTGFYKYSLSGNSWTGSHVSNTASIPGAISAGSQMIRNGADNDIYVTQGGGTGFYKYSISGNSWTTLPVIPGSIGYGSAMMRNGADNDIYVTQGNNGTGFYKYSISGNSWTTLTVIPGAVNRGSTMLRNASDNDIYVTQANGLTGFYKYSISGNSWTTLTSAPGAISQGSSAIRNGADNDIYVAQGGALTGFYKYSISGNSWTTLTVVPGSVSYDGGMIRNSSDNDIYLLRGGYTNNFYKYSISGNSWTALTVVPGIVNGDESILRNGSDNDIYVIQGQVGTNFYKYSISGNSWTTLAGNPSEGGFSGGSRAIRNGADNELYVTQGNNTTTFYKFIINSVTYPSSGTFTSNPINLGAPASSFSTLSWSATLSSQTITMKARSSATSNFSGAPAFSSCTNIISGTNLSTGGCVTDTHQYIQYQATLATSNSAVTPTLDSVIINYSQYTTGELTSSVYDSTSVANLIARVSWTESGESVTEHTKLQIRSSADNITWSNWCGFDDCSGSTYFDVSRNGVVLNTGHPLLSGNDDRYFQYKVTLVSGGALTPILTGVTVQYVVNATPEFDPNYPLTGDGGVSAMQNADGSVTINYSIIDNDTTQGSASAGFVTPTFQYSLDNGSTWAGIDGSAMNTGDTDNKAVQELTYTPYTATWHASTTLLGVYNNTVKVRVTINDNEIANSIAYGLSPTITLDTKAPTLGAYPILIDASPSPAIVTLSATDDSTFSMKVGRVPDLSDATYEAYTNTKELTLSSGNTVYAQFMDAVGNETAIVSLATLGSPTNIFYQDTSDVTTSEWREFFAWGVVQNPPSGFKRYNVMRSVDGGAFTLLTTITNRAINYYVDSSLNSGSSYSYQVSSEDNDGNISFFSPASEPHTPVGFGGSDLAGPTLDNVVVSDVSAVEATVTWTTNKLSNSTVYYSATSSYPGAEIVAYETSAGVPSMVTTNSVVLSGLTPGTQYFFLTASADASNNIGISSLPSYTFTTLAGPIISNVTPAEVYDSEATITWNTNIRADSTVVYSASPDISNPIQISGTGDFTRNHRVTLTGLTSGTDYYYYVKSADESSNVTIDKNVIDGVIEYFTFHTSYDTEPPIITDVDTSLVGETGATITWTTDKPATSWIDWGTDTSLGSSTVEDTVYSTRHSVTLNNLISNYPYFYRVNSNSRSGFLATDDNNGNEYTFTTSVPTTVSGGTRDNRDLTTPEISDIIITAITDTSAKIKFTTSKVANGLVQYGLTTKYTDEVGDPEQFSEKHSVLLSGLSPGTTYNFKIFANDIYENEGASRNSTLTTTMGGEVVADPVINEGIEDVGTSTPELTLFEKVKSASNDILEELFIAFSENPNLAGMSEENFIASVSSMATKVVEPPVIAGTTIVVNVNSTSAVIEWITDKEANTLVSYASAKEYSTGESPYTITTGFPDAKQTDHKIVLDNLIPATTYHFQVKSESILGTPSISDDSTFSTTSLLPDIKDAKFDTVGENSVTLSWNTELPTMTAIELKNTETGETRQVEDKSYLENHRTTLDNLEFSTAYVATLTGSDTNGNTSAPFAMPFSTALSSGAPLISDVKINTSLIPGRVQMAQTIISWKTSKPATSKVYYGTGGATEPTQSLPQNKTLTRDHVVITTTLQPGMVYKIRAESEDPAGNATSSSLYTILTPTTQGSVFDIIASNLSGMFGFLGGKK